MKYLKSIKHVPLFTVYALCFCFIGSTYSYELPIKFVKDSTDYLVRECNTLTNACAEKIHIKFRSLRLDEYEMFYIETGNNPTGTLVYEIAVLNKDLKLLSRCDIYVLDESIIDNECASLNSRVPQRRT